jgi:hypothetical protein
MKKKMILLPILLLIMVSCQSAPINQSTTIPEVVTVERAVLLTVAIEDEYTDGVFLLIDEWGKVKINYSRF